MSAPEKELLARELQKAKAYQEFGMGGSSLLAVREGVPLIVTVDSDPAWVASVRSHPEIAPRCADGTLLAIHADIGLVREWGNPLDRSRIEKWPNYISAAWRTWGRLDKLSDLVFVDGRFRVACCISTALVCVGASDLADVRVLMHDVSAERPHYFDALEFLEVVDREESMLLMKIRDDFHPAAAISRIFDQQFNFG